MAASSTPGSRGQLQFSANEAPDMGADETALSDQTAELGTRRVGTTAERNALSGAKKFEGLLWGDTTDGYEYRVVGGSWLKRTSPFAMATGTGTVSMTGTSTYFSFALPTGRFTTPPVVTILNRSNDQGVGFSAVATTATNINAIAWNGGNGVSAPYQWIAVQM